jgi:hypothetical protein
VTDWSVNQPEWAEALLRAGDLKGDSVLAMPQSAGPAVLVESMLAPEMHYLRRMQRYSTYLSRAALAANLSQCFWQVEGQGQNNTLCVVEQFQIANATAAQQFVQVQLVLATFNAGATLPGGVSDSRIGVNNASSLRGFTATNVAAVTTSNRGMGVRVLPGETKIVDCAFVLVNSQNATPAVPMLCFENQTANDSLVVGISWRERPLLTSER